MPSLAALRHAPWSTSKVKCAQRCAQEFHYRYVERIPEPEVSPEQRLGKAVHATLEKLLLRHSTDDALTVGRDALLLPEEKERFDRMAPMVHAFRARIDDFRVRRRPKNELVEAQLAIDATLRPTGFVVPEAFFRGILDAGFEWGDGEVALVDHKTGVRRLISDYVDQLEAYATLVVLAAPEAKRVWLGVHFVPDAAMEWSPPVSAEEVRASMLPRLLDNIEAAARCVTPAVPQPGRHCAWCSYRALCPAMRMAPPPPPEIVEDVIAAPEPPEGAD